MSKLLRYWMSGGGWWADWFLRTVRVSAPLARSPASSSPLPLPSIRRKPPHWPRAPSLTAAVVTVTRDSVTPKHPPSDWPGRSPVISLPNFRCKHSNPHFVRRPCRPSPSLPPPSLELVVPGPSPPRPPVLRLSPQRSLLTPRSSRSTAG